MLCVIVCDLQTSKNEAALAYVGLLCQNIIIIIKYFTIFYRNVLKSFYGILQSGAHGNKLTRILQDFSQAFYVITNILFVFLLYDTLKMVTRVTETCWCDK